MFRTIGRFTLILAVLVLTSLVTRPTGAQQAGKPIKPLTEADIVGLIGQQADDRPILKRLDTVGIAFKMDESTLTRIKQANPSPEVLARLGKFLPKQAELKPTIVEKPKVEKHAVVRAGKGRWEVLNSGVKEDLHSVAFINDQVGVAVGANYTILRTTDAGKTWNNVMTAPNKAGGQWFASVVFANDKLGWVKNGYNSETYRTDDGGATWKEVVMPGQPGTVYARSGFATHTVAGGTYFHMNYTSAFGGNFLSVTHDLGKSWTDLWDSGKGISSGSIAFPTAKEGWMAYVQGIPHRFYVGRTSDGGKTWTKQEMKDGSRIRGNYCIVRAVDNDHGWFVSHFAAHVFASTDGGKTWTPHELGNGSHTAIQSMQFRDKNTGYVLCGASDWYVRQTTDGGKNWASLGALNATNAMGMFFTPTGVGYVVGAKGYIARYQVDSTPAIEQPKVAGGKGAWKRQDSGVKDYLRDVAFIDEKIGVAVGDAATVIRTTDGGKTWSRAYQPKEDNRRDDLYRVLFSGPKEGWIISGIANTILHSKDAGATWNRVMLPSLEGRFNLAGTHTCTHAASGSRYFYLCWGLSGSHLFQTEDAGGSWKVVTSKITVSGAGLSIPDGKHGVYAARIGGPSTGYLGRTSDGGATWQVQKANDGKHSRGNHALVQMVDKDNGWYLPHYGTIHATTDGGKTWTAQELGHVSTSDLLALHFLDSKRGHVLCNYSPGEVRRTTDGGKSWTSLGKLRNPNNVRGMSFPTMQQGWVVGEKGYIEHYSEAEELPLERMLAGPPKGAWKVLDSGVKDTLHSVAFVNDQIGVAVGTNKTILRTTDGGKNWSRVIKSVNEEDHLASVTFANEKLGYIHGGYTGNLYRTKDAGATWEGFVNPNPTGLSSIKGFATHAAHGNTYFWMNYAGGFSSHALYRTDDAKNWTHLWDHENGSLGGSGARMVFTDAKDGWMASTTHPGERFYVGRSTDGGKTWKSLQIKDKVAGGYMLIQAVNKDLGWFSSGISNHVHASTDGGAIWTPYPLGNGSDDSVKRLQFVDAKVGYVLCGADYHVRKTNDSGKSWTALGKLKPPGAVIGMFFRPNGTGYVVGEKGYIARYQPAADTDEEMTMEPYDSKTQGAIQVKGETGDYFFISVNAKRMGNHLLQSTVEVAPGTYGVEVNQAIRTVKVEAGRKAVLRTGTLEVQGAKGGLWAPYQGKERMLTGNNPSVNEPLALFAGTYRVDVIQPGVKTYTLTANAQIVAGKRTVVKE